MKHTSDTEFETKIMMPSALIQVIGSLEFPISVSTRILRGIFRHFGAGFALCLLILSIVVFDVECGFATSAHEPELPSQWEGLVIERIVVEAQEVFGKEEAAKSRLFRALNHIHIATRRSVILRETLLKTGDVFNSDLALETERNLRDLPFIYQASVSIDTLDTAGVTLRIRTVDRWSLNTGLKVVRRSERNQFQIGLTESNLMGLGHRVGATYSLSDPDPSYASFEYRNPRLLGSFNEFDAEVVTNPLNEFNLLRFRRRYTRQADKSAYNVTYLNFRKRVLNVTELGDTAATFFQQGNRFSVSLSSRAGGYHNKLTTTLEYRYLNSIVEDISTFAGYGLDGLNRLIPPSSLLPSDTFLLPIDSSNHKLIISVNVDRADFYRERRLDFQKRVEDVTIINGLGVLYGQSRDRGFGEQLYSIWGLSAKYGFRISDIILAGSTRQTWWERGGGELRSAFQTTIVAYQNGLSWLTFAGRSSFITDKRQDNPNPLSVNGSRNVRGYPANFITGNKLLMTNLESRFFTGISALTSRLGFALHLDVGAAWGSGDKLARDRIVWSAGPGLRIDMGQIGTIRVDFSYLEALDSWSISASTGQFFDLYSLQ